MGSERYATPYEINDALATLHEMGASVIRVQTLGDTVGCALCEEPKPGVFNAAAFFIGRVGSENRFGTTREVHAVIARCIS